MFLDQIHGIVMSSELFLIALLIITIVLSLAVAWSDYRYRKIPNNYLLMAISLEIVVFIAMFVLFPFKFVIKGLMVSIIGMLIGGLSLYFPYKHKQVGAGDVKFMAVIGLLLGPKGAILSLLIGAMVGGLWALVLAWRIGGLGHMWYNIKFMARSAYLTGFREFGWDLRSEGAVAMPYGIALAAGTILVCLEQLHLHLHRYIGA